MPVVNGSSSLIDQFMSQVRDADKPALASSFGKLSSPIQTQVLAILHSLPASMQTNLVRDVAESHVSWIDAAEAAQMAALTDMSSAGAGAEEARASVISEAGRFKETLAAEGYEFADVNGDGDCLFHALTQAHELGAPESRSRAMQTRGLLRRYVLVHSDELKRQEWRFEGGIPKLLEALTRSAHGVTDSSDPRRGGLEHALLFASMSNRPLTVHCHLPMFAGQYNDSLIGETPLTGEPLHLFYDGQGHWDHMQPSKAASERIDESSPASSPSLRQRKVAASDKPKVPSPAPKSADSGTSYTAGCSITMMVAAATVTTVAAAGMLLLGSMHA